MSHFEQVSDIIDVIELDAVNNFLQDDLVERSLLKLTSILSSPEPNPAKIAKHIVECEAMAVAFGVKAKYYMTLGKDEPDYRAKKELYFTLREGLHELAAALKYLAKT